MCALQGKFMFLVVEPLVPFDFGFCEKLMQITSENSKQSAYFLITQGGDKFIFSIGLVLVGFGSFFKCMCYKKGVGIKTA